MRVYYELGSERFEPCSKVADIYETIRDAGKLRELEDIMMMDDYPDDISEEALYDYLWVNRNDVLEWLEIDEEKWL